MRAFINGNKVVAVDIDRNFRRPWDITFFFILFYFFPLLSIFAEEDFQFVILLSR